MNDEKHYYVMALIMIISGSLSTMNIQVDKISDIRYTLNDVYMILLMTGWMLLLMALNSKNIKFTIIGISLVIFNMFAIRTQFGISQEQYLLGMIPHHSMAVFMSKKMKMKKNDITQYLDSIILGQENEIIYMKEKSMI